MYASGGAAALVNGSEVSLRDAASERIITAGAGTVGDGVTSISFVAANLNSTAVTTGVTLLAYSADGIGGGPGTLLGEFQTQTLTLSASSVGLETYTSATPLFTVPSGLFWLGISYNNEDGTLPVTAAQLDNLWLGIYNPPTRRFQPGRVLSGNLGQFPRHERSCGWFLLLRRQSSSQLRPGTAGQRPRHHSRDTGALEHLPAAVGGRFLSEASPAASVVRPKDATLKFKGHTVIRRVAFLIGHAKFNCSPGISPARLA